MGRRGAWVGGAGTDSFGTLSVHGRVADRSEPRDLDGGSSSRRRHQSGRCRARNGCRLLANAPVEARTAALQGTSPRSGPRNCTGKDVSRRGSDTGEGGGVNGMAPTFDGPTTPPPSTPSADPTSASGPGGGERGLGAGEGGQPGGLFPQTPASTDAGLPTWRPRGSWRGAVGGS
eukprot:7563701-Pyramimonas_sp.AAC.1